MVTLQILKFVDFTKTEKSRYLKNETFFLQMKRFINYKSRATLWQKNTFVGEVTLTQQIELKALVCWSYLNVR